MIALPTISILTVIFLVGTIVALIDGIIRARGRGNTILAIVEIVIAALLLLSLFVAIPIGTIVLSVVLLIVLVLQLVLRGSVRGGAGVSLTVVALIAIAIWLVLALGWITHRRASTDDRAARERLIRQRVRRSRGRVRRAGGG